MPGLPDELAAVVSGLNGLANDLGVRRVRVYYGRRTWSGGEVGAGDPVETFTEVAPPPKVSTWDGMRWARFSGGELPRGDVLVSLIPVTTDPATLTELTVPAGVEALWKFVDGDTGRTTYLRPAGGAEFRASGWRVRLSRIED